MDTTPDTRLQVHFKPGGSLKLSGTFVLHYPDGRTEELTHASFCRCGFSKIMPFCDGVHKQLAWMAPPPPAESDL